MHQQMVIRAMLIVPMTMLKAYNFHSLLHSFLSNAFMLLDDS